uniref:Uncharacterized protein n=1 Tax=Oryza sativa subsp. japonica TaxID=39947 RepID=Q6Z5I3_ORYSJ|nr:hypothetical protein [Oryza sativa Japonica Group]
MAYSEPHMSARLAVAAVDVATENASTGPAAREVPRVLGVRRCWVKEHRDATDENENSADSSSSMNHDPPWQVVLPWRATEVGAGWRHGELLNDPGAHGLGAPEPRRTGECPKPAAVASPHPVLPPEHMGVGGRVQVGWERHAEVDALPRVGLDGEHRRVADRWDVTSA